MSGPFGNLLLSPSRSGEILNPNKSKIYLLAVEALSSSERFRQNTVSTSLVKRYVSESLSTTAGKWVRTKSKTKKRAQPKGRRLALGECEKQNNLRKSTLHV